MYSAHPQLSTPIRWKIGNVLVNELKFVRDLDAKSDSKSTEKKPTNITDEEWAYRCTVKNNPPLSALCLSGGGIRSAAFCLGIIQALANKELLSKFDYLSTVSGGGFIGAWLSTLIKETDIKRTENTLKTERPGDPLGHLRGFSNYLTPHSGIGSTDTWTGITLYLRNFLINWLVYLPLFLSLVLLAIFYRTIIFQVGMTAAGTISAFAVAALAMLFAVSWACVDLPSHRPSLPKKADRSGSMQYVSEPSIRNNIVLPALVWCFVVPIILIRDFAKPPPPSLFNPPIDLLWNRLDLMSAGLVLAITYFFILQLGYGVATYRKRDAPGELRLYYINSGWWFLASLCSFLFLCIGAWIGHLCIEPKEAAQAIAVFAPGWLVLAHVLQTTVYVALRVEVPQADLDREWLARVSALLLRITLSWTLFAYCSLVLSERLFFGSAIFWASWPLPIGALLSGPIAAWIGKTAVATVTSENSQTGNNQVSINILLSILPVIFGIALFTTLGALAEYALGWAQIGTATAQPNSMISHLIGAMFEKPDLTGWMSDPNNRGAILDVLVDYNYLDIWSYLSPARENLIWTLQISPLPFVFQLTCVIFLVLMSVLFVKRVNANRFSLHAIYRNRLARAFIGTAREPKRCPEPFTGFDPEDSNQRLMDLKAKKLFLVINMTLNLTRQSRTAWAERKAASFFATPLACGSAALDGNLLLNPERHGFVPTSAYAGKEHHDSDVECKGLTLAASIAISGAAVSPNWGYHSSPLTAFVMTLFNMRLGAWLPNPATVKSTADLSVAKPKNPFAAINGDLLGQTTDDSQAIYLSDGGHFENLGLYEMLRRRCRQIIVVDAGEDGQAKFEDIGNAIRKAYIDMQIEVKIDLPFGSARKTTEVKNNENSLVNIKPIVGCICYPEGARGIVIYIKPGWFESMPADVRAYGEKNFKFPHQSTANQWFGESQFESYRKLGVFQGSKLTELASDSGNLNSFFCSIYRKAKKKSPSTESC